MLVPPSIVSDPALFIVIVFDPLFLNLISSPSVAELKAGSVTVTVPVAVSYNQNLYESLIVNASRIPPRPLAGQRLEDAGQQLEAWKAPRESSWRRLRASKPSPGELLEAH